jgi:hypothetical protein
MLTHDQFSPFARSIHERTALRSEDSDMLTAISTACASLLEIPLQNSTHLSSVLLDLYSLLSEFEGFRLVDLPLPVRDLIRDSLLLYSKTSEIDLIDVVLSLLLFFVSQDSVSSVFLLEPDVIDACSRIALSDHFTFRVQRYALRLLKFMCYDKDQFRNFTNYILTQHTDLVIALTQMQKSECLLLKTESLCLIWTLLKNKPNPELISRFSSVVTNICERINDECFDYVISVAAAFIECGGSCAHFVADQTDFPFLFAQFPSFPMIVQTTLLYFFMSHIENSEVEDRQPFVDHFSWEITSSVKENGCEEEIFNFLRLATSVFVAIPILIESAASNGVLNYLFELTEGSTWPVARYAMIALIHAFQYGSREIANNLIVLGLPGKLAIYLESDSVILTAKIKEALELLVHLLHDNGQETLAEELAALNWTEHSAETVAQLGILFSV